MSTPFTLLILIKTVRVHCVTSTADSLCKCPLPRFHSPQWSQHSVTNVTLLVHNVSLLAMVTSIPTTFTSICSHLYRADSYYMSPWTVPLVVVSSVYIHFYIAHSDCKRPRTLSHCWQWCQVSLLRVVTNVHSQFYTGNSDYRCQYISCHC